MHLYLYHLHFSTCQLWSPSGRGGRGGRGSGGPAGSTAGHAIRGAAFHCVALVLNCLCCQQDPSQGPRAPSFGSPAPWLAFPALRSRIDDLSGDRSVYSHGGARKARAVSGPRAAGLHSLPGDDMCAGSESRHLCMLFEAAPPQQTSAQPSPLAAARCRPPARLDNTRFCCSTRPPAGLQIVRLCG